MNLKNLSDKILLANTKRLALGEREFFTNLLHHLREVERRRLFCELKCQSLFEYIVKELKFSESEANRRISAMRLLRDIPEIDKKIIDGSLNLTNLNLAQALFNKERKAGRRYSADQKRAVLAKLENQSARQAIKIVSEINPEMKKEKPLTYENIEDDGLRAKLLHVQGIYAHTNPGMTLTELLHKLCDNAIAEKNKSPSAPKVDSEAEIYRKVEVRDCGKCTQCASTYAIEHDHIVPKAAGGKTTVENLRLLCKNCNQRAAIRYYGRRKMGQYMRSHLIEYSRSPVIEYTRTKVTETNYMQPRATEPKVRIHKNGLEPPPTVLLH